VSHADTLRQFGLRDEDLAAWRDSAPPDEAFNAVAMSVVFF
jgi:hypothetical protein